jgi:hypothetical protein
MLPEDGVVLLVDADGVGDRVGPAPGVVQDRVEIGDLAQAVTAQLQRRGHEAQPPLADVERRPAIVVGCRVPVGNHHLGERQAVRDRSRPVVLAVADGMQHQSLAVVEPDPH